MFIAERIVDQSSKQQRGKLRYLVAAKESHITVEEDTALVDGIGGTTWEGALVLANALESITSNADNTDDIAHCHVLELGCGTGLVGIVAHRLGFRVTISDRVADLAASNVLQNCVDTSASRKRRAFSRDGMSHVKSSKHRTQEVMHSVDPDYMIEEDLSRLLTLATEDRKRDFEELVQVISLPWGTNIFEQHVQQNIFSATVKGSFAQFHAQVASSSSSDAQSKNSNEEIWSIAKLCRERGNVDIVVGAEITCLRKQHNLLIETVAEVAKANPKVILLFTFDGVYNKDTPASIYEKEFIEKMRARRFRHSLISQAQVQWQDISNYDGSSSRYAKILYQSLPEGSVSDIVFPRPVIHHRGSNTTMMDSDDCIICMADDDKENVFNHHVVAFYLSEALHTCQRCHREFCAQSNCRTPSQSGNLFNTLVQAGRADQSEGCRFHHGLFVCRRHPAETRCSINGLGDNLGYYGNGKEGWKAEFWDCCGSEDPNNPGCMLDRHIPY